MSEVPLFPFNGEGVIFDPQQVLGPYVWPQVKACDATLHFWQTGLLEIKDTRRPRVLR